MTRPNLMIRVEVYRPTWLSKWSWRRWVGAVLSHILIRMVHNDRSFHVFHRFEFDPRDGVTRDIRIGMPGVSVVGGSDDSRYRLFGYAVTADVREGWQ